MPKVSVIIPVYGVEKYIERCARSLFEQTLADMEFIFIDDCTPDRSIEILKLICDEYRLRFAEENKSVRIVKMPSNNGQAAVRRHGIQLATGDYIIHCDSDDWVEVSAYEKMYIKAVTESCDIVICDYFLSDGIDKRERIYLPCIAYNNKDYYWSKLLRGEASTSVWTKLIKRELYNNNSLVFPKCNMWEDYVLTVQLVRLAKKIGYVDDCLYYYYFNPNSICNTNIDRNQQQIMENANVILLYLATLKGSLTATSNDVICFKYNARYELSKHVASFKYWRQWHNTFPEIRLKYLFLNDVPIREKFRFLSIYMGVYPIIQNVLSKFRKLTSK